MDLDEERPVGFFGDVAGTQDEGAHTADLRLAAPWRDLWFYANPIWVLPI
ncbi:hypothetical protein [Spongiactinospora sp. TRM90649]|nr:hypothetical protein [Spongiactinospora sp. TRM90649]MDF5754411.1 hypothetical protein [Spongiactinospora sp. TRM90649]